MPRGTSVLASAAGTILAVILGVTAGWITGGDGGTAQASPTPPADCFVADEPTATGPMAPTDLVAGATVTEPFFQFDLAWSDQSDDETCFVLELNTVGLQYEVIAILEPDTTSYRDEGPYQDGVVVFYRIYAARDNDRSEYSNVAGADIPVFDPTPSPSPPATPTPLPAPNATPTPTPEETASPSPPLSPAASPTPAQLPDAGGPAEGRSTPVAILIVAGATLLILSAAVVFCRRPAEAGSF